MKTTFALSRQYRFRMCGMLAGVLTASALFAQSPLPRIHNEINPAQAAVIEGSRHPLASPQNDAGRMAPDGRVNGITLYFNRSAAQQADLNALLAAQQDPSSPQYHHWLTPDQFATRFGMAQPDIDKVKTWLEQQGFAINSIMRSRTGIRFSGSVGQIESAFQTQMHYYTVGGQKHFAPSTALSVPAGLAGVVAGVRNLDDFRPRPQHISMKRNFTSATSGNVFFSPGDIVTTYDIQPLYSAGIDGTGQTIAIMGQSFVNVADVEAFQAAAGLPKKDPQMVLVPGTGSDATPSKGDESESDLDLEWSGAMAPGATVAFVYTGSDNNFGVYDSAQYAVDNLIGNIISLSYSSCETELSQANLTALENIFSQAATQGQTVMAASGDEGSTACSGDTRLTTAQQEAVIVNYPASSAFVTGIGGTETATGDGSGNSTYWTSASGTDVTSSAKQYIPEVVWNDDSSQNGLSASGGGTSTLVARPSWQTGVPGIPSGSNRLVPDISFYSSPDAPGYLYCTSDSSSWGAGQAASCNNGFRDNSSALLTVAGGTSFATPIFAGMMALLNENGKYVSGSGEVNSTLYKLASNSTTYGTVFHDVKTGNNNCNAGSQFCSGTAGFSAGAGYDEATGLGSVDVAKLAAVWPINSGASASLISTNTNVTPSNPNPNVGESVTFTVGVSAQDGSTPTGAVTLQIDGGTAWGVGGTTVTNQTLTNGTVTYTTSFTGCGGTHQVLALYSGDASHAPSTGIVEVSIATKCTISVKATDVSTKQGSTGTSTITVTPGGGYTGTVLLGIDFGSANTTLANLCFSFTTMDNNGNGTLDVTGAAAGTTTLSLDTNAADCTSATGALKKPGMRPLKVRMSGATHADNKGNGNGKLPAGIAFGGLLLAGLLGRQSRKLRNLACILALACAGFALSACGSSSGVKNGPSNPPKGTYTGTVTGTDQTSAAVTSSATFTFTIN
jgi:hypothetical protein